MNGQITFAELAEQQGVTIRAIQTRFEKAGGAQFDRHAKIPHEMIAALTATRKANTRKPRAKRAVVSPIVRSENQTETLRNEIAKLRDELSVATAAKLDAQNQSAQLREMVSQLEAKLKRKAGSFQWLLDGINVLEIGLIIVGCVMLLGWVAGLLVSLIASAFYTHTVIKIRNPEVSNEAKNWGIGVVCIIASGVVWLHGQSFWYLLRSEISGGLRETVACFIAWAMTLIPIFSLFQTRNINE